MKQTILTAQERPLLSYALSKLNPDIFSHPVWIRFGRQTVTNAPTIAVELLSGAKRIVHDDPNAACQVLLASAVYQNIAGQNDMALETINKVMDLAKSTGFSYGALWARWGACAVLFQQEKFEQAAQQLEELETVLTELNEWVLADFVNVIKQAMYQPEIVGTWRQADMFDGSSSSDLLTFTCRWLQKWGLVFWDPEPDRRLKRPPGYVPDFFHKFGWKRKVPTNGGRRLSVWQSLRSLLRIQQYGRKTEPQTGREEVSQKTAGNVPNVPEPVPVVRNQESVIDPFHPATSPQKISASKKKASSRKKTSRISLTIQMLGPFRITIQDFSPKLPTSRALSVFQYLLLHHKQDTPREVLMELFWPDAEPGAARNNLNVAIHKLRQALRKVTDLTVICFEEGAYRLANNLEIWLDVDEFDHCVKEGRKSEAINQLTVAIAEYEIAINLYQGDLLADLPYEEWPVLERERLRVAYLDTLDRLSQIHFSQERYSACLTLCQIIINRDVCREDIHCRIMKCYSRLSQRSLALRQYQICAEALHAELDVEPAPETIYLYEQIRRHQYA